MHSNLLLPHITNPTIITAKSTTLIGNILSNIFDSSSVSGNIVTALCDHHGQFLVIANQAKIDFENPHHLYRDFRQIEKNKTAIKNQFESIDWNRVPRLSCSDINLFF